MKQYNVLFILSDQHRYCSMPSVEDSQVIAPNLKSLMGKGISFTNCYSNYPLCSPARAMIMSGKLPDKNRVVHNDIELESTRESLGYRFKDSGYNTCYIGKFHLHGGEGAPDSNDRNIPSGDGRHGFDTCYIWNETNQHYSSNYYDDKTGENVRYHGYNAIGMTNQAIDYIHNIGQQKPFCMWLNYNPPHPPLHDAPEEYKALYDIKQIKLKPNVPRSYSIESRKVSAGAHRNDITMTLKEQYKQYYAHISAMDYQLGRIMNMLRDNNMLDNTIIIYHSDHGDMLWSQDRARKGCFYSESTKVPLVICAPFAKGEGVESDALISTIDIYPTLQGLVDITIPEWSQGIDMSHYIKGQVGPQRDEVLHYSTHKNDIHFQDVKKGIRTMKYLYFEEEGKSYLYNYIKDPYEMNNLADSPQCKEIIDELRAKMGYRINA